MRFFVQPRVRAAIIGATLALAYLCYAYLKRANLAFSAGDQWVYFAASYLFSDGVIPYRDFFFSHAPLQILLSTLLVKMGADLVALSILPSVIGGLSGLVLFHIAQKRMGDVRAVLALIFFLLSYANVMSTLYYTGQELGLFVSLIGMHFFLSRKKGVSGVLMGLSACASINMLVSCFVLTCTQWQWNRKYLPLFFAAMVGAFGLIQFLFIGIAGWTYVEQTYLYHLAKPDSSTWLASNAKVFWMMTHAHGMLILLAILGFACSLREKREGDVMNGEKQKLLTLAASITSAHILFLMLIHPIFPHYFVTITPFLAILAAESIMVAWKWAASFVPARKHFFVMASATAGILLFTGSMMHTLRLYRIEQYLLGVPHVVEVAESIRTSIPEDATIFGEFGIAPLVSLLSGRRLAANMVDSSEMRIMGKQTTMQEMIDAIEADNVQILVSRERRGINAYPPFWKYRDAHFFLARTFKAEGYPTAIEVWRRR